jgi:hypothetical protein
MQSCSGDANVAIGSNAFRYRASGAYSVAIGASAGFNDTLG